MDSILEIQTRSPQAVASMAKPVSLLLVDDEAKNLTALESILDSPEYRLVRAQTADEALMALMREEFAAIVLDVQMPETSGIELAKLIKQRKKTQHIPILFLTAYYQEDEHVVLGYDVGAVDYLTKPVNPAVLRSKVGVFVDLFRKTRALAELNSAMADEIIERQRAEERFRLVVESAPNAMVVVSRGGFITLVNSQTELLFGYERGELLDQAADILLPAEFSLIPNGKETLEAPSSVAWKWETRELFGRRKDGSEVSIEIGVSVINAPEGNSFLASIVDITDRKRSEAALRSANAELAAKNAELQRQAEERGRRIRAEAAQAEAEAARERSAFLAEASSVLAVSFDYHQTLEALARLVVPKLADCCVIDIVEEDGASHPLVIAEESGMGKNILEFWRTLPAQSDPKDPSSCGKPAVGLDQEHGAVCVMPPHAAERARALGIRSYMIIPLKARGRTLGCLCLISIRDREYSDFDIPLGEELAQRAGLALDNSRLYNDARIAREAAEAANAAKDRFLAMLSHELRTPLSPVLHSVAYIEGESEIAPRVREALGTIRRNVQLEARLIDDLLDLARIRNGKLQLQREVVDAHELIHRTVEICHAQIVAHQLEVRFDFRAERSKLHADPARIQQIFWNLITNALKFSPAGGALVIATSDEDGVFRAEVTDQGRGIPADKLERIFDAFEQADGTRSSGLGLGLAICRALVHLHGGTINAVSEGTGRGAAFIISLPAASEAELKAPEEPASPSAAPAPALRLLVVEDHLDTATALRKLLVRRGYEVRSAETVAQALEIAEDFDFDVLVSDIGLPDGTGVDLMLQLSATEGRRAFRGIALSGFGMQEDLERSSAAGFSHHLTKPVDFPLLDRTLVRIGQELERGS